MPGVDFAAFGNSHVEAQAMMHDLFSIPGLRLDIADARQLVLTHEVCSIDGLDTGVIGRLANSRLNVLLHAREYFGRIVGGRAAARKGEEEGDE